MPQEVKIIEAVNSGYLIKNLHTKSNQLIPAKLLLNRIKWGIYTLINPEMIQQ